MADAWTGDEPRTWHAGPWSLEVREDEFADLAFRGQVVLRSVRAVMRDRNWDTASVVVDRIDESELAITLHVRSVGFGADLRGIVRAEARGDRLVVLTDLESASEFWTNRTGLVVLHPPVLAGSALRVTHGDGREEESVFPEAISPHQPALDIAALAWNASGLDVGIRFSGDVFEMEDQRNWTDASYKTYSRPLALPFPYRLTPGERVVQSIEISVTGEPIRAEASDTVRIRLDAGPPLPVIAVSAATAPDPAPSIEHVGAVVLVELDLATTNWRAALERAAASGRPLDVRFVLADDEPGAIYGGVVALRGAEIARVSAFWPTGAARHISDVAATALLRTALADAGVEASVVGGARSHFTELNREHHRLPADLDGIVFSVTPLFHSLGTAQLVESLPMQRLVATQAARIAAGLPVHVGPVSLRPHFNDVATTPPPMTDHDDLRDGYGSALIDVADTRQTAPQLAAWAVASAAALAVPGVATLTMFEEWGPRGLVDAAGEPYPVHDAVAALADLAGAPGLRGDSPDGLVWAIGARTDEGDIVVVANLDRVERSVTIETSAGVARSVELAPGTFRRLA
jgi:hypothetical protein